MEMSGCFRSDTKEDPDDEDIDSEVQSTSFSGRQQNQITKLSNGVQMIGHNGTSYCNASYEPDADDTADYDQITVTNTQVSVIESSYHLTPDSTPCPNHQFKLNGSCLCDGMDDTDQWTRRSSYRDAVCYHSSLDLDNNVEKRLLKVTEKFPLAYLTPEKVKVSKFYSSMI